MTPTTERSFLRKTTDWLGLTSAPKMETRGQGSTGSYGGDSPLPGVMPTAREVKDEVTVETALSMSAVYRSIDILQNTVSQLELGVYRGVNELKTVPGLVARPDVNTPTSTFLKRTVMSLAANGNAYWRLYRNDALETPANIEVLNPRAMAIRYDTNGKKTFEYNGYSGKTVTFQPHQIHHLKLMEVFGYEFGTGPIQACRNELTANLDLRQYATNVFSEYPTGILSTKDYLDSEMADENKKRWYASQANGERLAVLGNGYSYQPIMLSPEDSQFIENQKFNTTAVARMFGIPPNYLLADSGSSMTYQNLQDVDTMFIRYTVQAYLTEIENAFSELLPRGQRAKFKTEMLLRSQPKERAEIGKTALAGSAWQTINEFRASEGMPPIEGGDVLPTTPKEVLPDTSGNNDNTE